MSKIKKLYAVVADKGYDSEKSHVLVREKLWVQPSYLQDMNRYLYGRLMAGIEGG